jgi:hypothetical protein
MEGSHNPRHKPKDLRLTTGRGPSLSVGTSQILVLDCDPSTYFRLSQRSSTHPSIKRDGKRKSSGPDRSYRNTCVSASFSELAHCIWALVNDGLVFRDVYTYFICMTIVQLSTTTYRTRYGRLTEFPSGRTIRPGKSRRRRLATFPSLFIVRSLLQGHGLSLSWRWSLDLILKTAMLRAV